MYHLVFYMYIYHWYWEVMLSFSLYLSHNSKFLPPEWRDRKEHNSHNHLGNYKPLSIQPSDINPPPFSTVPQFHKSTLAI